MSSSAAPILTDPNDNADSNTYQRNKNTVIVSKFPLLLRQPSFSQSAEILRSIFEYDLISRDSTNDCYYPVNGSAQLEESRSIISIHITLGIDRHSEPLMDPICRTYHSYNQTAHWHNEHSWTKAQLVAITSVSFVLGVFFLIAAAMRVKNCIERNRERIQTKRKYLAEQRRKQRRIQMQRERSRFHQTQNVNDSSGNKGSRFRGLLMVVRLGRSRRNKQQSHPDRIMYKTKNVPQRNHVSVNDDGHNALTFDNAQSHSDNSHLKPLQVSYGSPQFSSLSASKNSKQAAAQSSSLTNEIDSIFFKHFGSRPPSRGSNLQSRSNNNLTFSNVVSMTMRSTPSTHLKRSNTHSGHGGDTLRLSHDAGSLSNMQTRSLWLQQRKNINSQTGKRETEDSDFNAVKERWKTVSKKMIDGSPEQRHSDNTSALASRDTTMRRFTASDSAISTLPHLPPPSSASQMYAPASQVHNFSHANHLPNSTSKKEGKSSNSTQETDV